jgi:hypothetical protein
VAPVRARTSTRPARAIEFANSSLRKLTWHRGAFPNDDALVKLIHLALHNFSKKWTMPIRDWNAALNQFTIRVEGRRSQPQTETPFTQKSVQAPANDHLFPESDPLPCRSIS